MEMKGANIIISVTITVLFCLAATPSSAAKQNLIASYYSGPYVPSACFGDEPLDPNLYLISLGDELWDNGNACGSIYAVKCLPVQGNDCVAHEGGSMTARGKVVDHCKNCGNVDLLLSEPAYLSIAHRDGKRVIEVSFEKV